MIADISNPYKEFLDLFAPYGLDQRTQEITTENFVKMLTDLRIIDEEGEEKKYFDDEYQLEDGGTISVKSTLADDYKDFMFIAEQLCFCVLSLIAEYCGHRGASVKDELMMAKQGIARGGAGDGRGKPNNMFIHQFDFKRWFQMEVWNELRGREPFDMEVVNLAVSYMST